MSSVPTCLDAFAEVWLADFEFLAPAGERPTPICCVALELRSGRLVRLWDAELQQPLRMAPTALYVAYYASAEMGCHIALGWPLPSYVLDLFAEFRVLTNGREGQVGVEGASLLAALKFFGLSHLDPDGKSQWRARILAGPPYTPAECAGILDYCESDVRALQKLLPKLVAYVEGRPFWLPHALLRGRFMRAAARMESVGVPLDVEMLTRLRHRWPAVKVAVVEKLQERFPFFSGSSLKMDEFERWLAQRDMVWPRTASGRLSTADDTFKDMVRVYPELAPVREVIHSLGKLRIADLAVGADRRNRTLLSPFKAKTGRNQPSNSKFIFGPSVWIRSLIQPRPGRALAYIDFSSQEIGIAAALSGDAAMQRAYLSGDPYLAFAIEAGLAPPDATKATHKTARDRCKAVVLGTLYGMQEESLALRLGIDVAEARRLLLAHRRAYRVFWAWVERATDSAKLQNYIDTCFGWRLHVTAETRTTSLLNHPMQAHGAEMLRLACILVTEQGIDVCAPVHDALLVECAESELDGVVAQVRALMGRASRLVLAGFEVRTDAEVIHYPSRYQDPRGAPMWGQVLEVLDRLDAQDSGVGSIVSCPAAECEPQGCS